MNIPGSQQAFSLPALRSLGELAGAEPVVVINTREQDPLPFDRLKTRGGTLITGDYSVAGLESLFAVERNIDIRPCGLLHRTESRALGARASPPPRIPVQAPPNRRQRGTD